MFENEAATALLAGGRCACQRCTGTLTDSSRSRGGWSVCRSAAARGRSARSTASVTRQQFTPLLTTRHDMKRGPEHAVPVEPVHTCGSASGSPAPQTLFEVPRRIQCCRRVFPSTDALGAWSLIEDSERPKATVLLL